MNSLGLSCRLWFNRSEMGKSVEITFVVFALFVVKSFRRVARWVPACAGMTAGAGSVTLHLRGLSRRHRDTERKRGCLWIVNRAVHDDRCDLVRKPLRASVAL